MVDMEIVMQKVIEYLKVKGYDIITTYNNVAIFKDEDCIVICRVRYTTEEYEQDPTRDECEKIMSSMLKHSNLEKIGPVRFDDIQVLDLENGRALIRHHIDACND